jgi:hypothetical protein
MDHEWRKVSCRKIAEFVHSVWCETRIGITHKEKDANLYLSFYHLLQRLNIYLLNIESEGLVKRNYFSPSWVENSFKTQRHRNYNAVLRENLIRPWLLRNQNDVVKGNCRCWFFAIGVDKVISGTIQFYFQKIWIREVEEVRRKYRLNTFGNHIHARQTLVDFISESDIQKMLQANRWWGWNNSKKIKEASKLRKVLRPTSFEVKKRNALISRRHSEGSGRCADLPQHFSDLTSHFTIWHW